MATPFDLLSTLPGQTQTSTVPDPLVVEDMVKKGYTREDAIKYATELAATGRGQEQTPPPVTPPPVGPIDPTVTATQAPALTPGIGGPQGGPILPGTIVPPSEFSEGELNLLQRPSIQPEVVQARRIQEAQGKTVPQPGQSFPSTPPPVESPFSSPVQGDLAPPPAPPGFPGNDERLEAARLGQGARVERAQAEGENAKQVSESLKKWEQETTQEQSVRKAAMFDVEKRLKEIETSMANSRIDGDRWWRNQSDGQKVAWGVAIFLSSLGQIISKTPGENGIIRMMREAIDRDIASQRFDFEAKTRTAQALTGDLNRLRASFADQDAADRAIRGLKLQRLAADLEARLKGPEGPAEQEAQAAGLDLIGKLKAEGQQQLDQSKRMEVQNVADLARVGALAAKGQQGIYTGVPNVDRALQGMSPDARKAMLTRIVKEQGDRDAYQNSAKIIGQAFDEMQELGITVPFTEGIPLTEARAKGPAIRAGILTQLQAAWKGPMTEEDRKVVERLLPERNDTWPQIQAKRVQLLRALENNRAPTPTLDHYVGKPGSQRQLDLLRSSGTQDDLGVIGPQGGVLPQSRGQGGSRPSLRVQGGSGPAAIGEGVSELAVKAFGGKRNYEGSDPNAKKHSNDMLVFLSAVRREQTEPDALREELASKPQGDRIAFAIRRAAQAEGVPEDLLLAMAKVESNFKPDVASGTDARGLFQFTRGTGRAYGIYNGVGDDRRGDIVLNSRAAAQLLKDNLRDLTGKTPQTATAQDWDLAIAAHNAGKGRVAALVNAVDAEPQVEEFPDRFRTPIDPDLKVPRFQGQSPSSLKTGPGVAVEERARYR